MIPGGVARAPNRNILYLQYGQFPKSKRTVAGLIPDSGIFRKRFKAVPTAGASKGQFAPIS